MYSSNAITSRFTLLRSVLVTVFMTLLLAGAALATEPEEVDPDPGFTQMQMTVGELMRLDPASLAPGQYLLWVVWDDGRVEWVELVVP